MAVTIDATIGGGSSNSYLTLADADSYMAERLNTTTWDDASDDEKKQALITATRRLDQERWEGIKEDDDNALEWPRDGAEDQNGYEYGEDEIPQPIKDATVELAQFMLAEDLLDQTGLEGFEEVEIGPISVVPRHMQEAGDLPEHVKREVGFLITSRDGNPRLWRA